MQFITPSKFKEKDFKKIEAKSLFIGEGSNFVNLFQVAWECNEEKKIAPLLASIAPYDNTVFNYRQCEMILLEIEEISKMRDLEDITEILNILKSIDSLEYLLLRGD